MVLFKSVNQRLLMHAIRKYSDICTTEIKRNVCKRREHFDPRPPAPPGQQIKICSADTLRQICPPEPCQCPPKPIPLTNAERSRLTLLLLAKIFIFFIVVKYINELGIWTTSDKTEELYTRMYQAVEPTFTDPKKPRRGPIQLPSPSNLIYGLAHAWNRGIIKLFSLFGLESYPKKQTDDDDDIKQKHH